jgi:hypothetical protein
MIWLPKSQVGKQGTQCKDELVIKMWESLQDANHISGEEDEKVENKKQFQDEGSIKNPEIVSCVMICLPSKALPV